MSGTLYVVATPIGNLDDLAPRARQLLAEVDLIASEDTRHTGRLLSHFGVKTPQFPLHDHNEDAATTALIERLSDGQSIALVSDAGTPLVSDPGYRLLRSAHAANIRVSPVPGASALTAAISVAGIASDRFSFEGFLPTKQKARRDTLQTLSAERRTLVFYESVHRINETLADLVAIFGADRQAFIGRELSKLHEQCVNAPLGELARRIQDDSIKRKGEFVLVVAGSRSAQPDSIEADRLLRELLAVMPSKQAAAIAAKVTGGKRNELYSRILELKELS